MTLLDYLDIAAFVIAATAASIILYNSAYIRLYDRILKVLYKLDTNNITIEMLNECEDEVIRIDSLWYIRFVEKSTITLIDTLYVLIRQMRDDRNNKKEGIV